MMSIRNRSPILILVGSIMATGYAGGYADGGYDAAYDDEYPEQKPYPHPGIRGLQYGGDGRQYAAGGLPGGGQWGYEDDGGYGYGEGEEETSAQDPRRPGEN